MQLIALKNLHQIEFTSLDDLIEKENIVIFLDSLALNKRVEF
jgi:hypothetical protein